MNKTCETCRWRDEHLCRRNPPQLVLWPQDNQHPIIYSPSTTYPMVAPDNWCGEHKPILTAKEHQ